MVSVLKELVTIVINQPHDWSKSPDIIIDISTAYRWLRTLTRQALKALPTIRKALLKIKPEHPIMDTTDAQPESLTSTRVILKRFLSLAGHLFKAAVRLADQNDPQDGDVFCFLNYFLAQQTGKALLLT